MIVVLANGCFDPLHWGHLKYLEASKMLGDILVVSITADAHVNKGPNRPIFNQTQRAEMVFALKCVDDVAIVENGAEAIRVIKPDIFTKGKEYEGRLPEQKLVEAYGGRVVFIDTPVYSSTRIVTGDYLRLPRAASG